MGLRSAGCTLARLGTCLCSISASTDRFKGINKVIEHFEMRWPKLQASQVKS